MGESFVTYTSRYGEPILRFKTGVSFEDRQFGDIPYECCVFKIDHVTKVMVVCRFNDKDEWHCNCCERAVINELLSRVAVLSGAVAEQPITQVKSNALREIAAYMGRLLCGSPSVYKYIMIEKRVLKQWRQLLLT